MRYKLFALAAEFMFDLVPPHDADKSAGKRHAASVDRSTWRPALAF